MKDESKRNIRRCAQVALFSLAAASQPFAQQPDESIAQLRDVHGNVLVSKESGLASGDEGLRLTKGTRVITTAKSDVVVVFDKGCEVRLKENQRFEVEEGRPCAALIAQAQSILLEPAGAATAGAAGSLAVYSVLVPALGGGAAGLVILQGLRETQAVSPS